MNHKLNSLDHPLLDPYRNLIGGRRSRKRDWFIVEGRWGLERLLDSPFETVSVVLGDQVTESILHRIPDHVDVLQLPAEMVSQLVGFEFHSGILGCGRKQRRRDLSSVESRLQQSRATVVICPYTVLPDNLGSIIRLCCGFGVDALIAGRQGADPFGRRSIRVSMGNIFRLPIIEPDDTLAAMLRLKNEFGFHLLAATGSQQATPLPFCRPAGRIALVMGNEAEGLNREQTEACDTRVMIPMSGETDSLNVANATAILLYQFTRVE